MDYKDEAVTLLCCCCVTLGHGHMVLFYCDQQKCSHVRLLIDAGATYWSEEELQDETLLLVGLNLISVPQRNFSLHIYSIIYFIYGAAFKGCGHVFPVVFKKILICQFYVYGVFIEVIWQ